MTFQVEPLLVEYSNRALEYNVAGSHSIDTLQDCWIGVPPFGAINTGVAA